MSEFSNLTYFDGFGNHVSTEAIEGALPVGQNSPQVCPLGLYAEQLSGTAFTAPRCKNLRSWLYRIRPSVQHTAMIPVANQTIEKDFDLLTKDPNQLRWSPARFPVTESYQTFFDGLQLKCGGGDPSMKSGLAIYDFVTNKSMVNSAVYSADGDFLIVPQKGTLFIQTEFGKFSVEPCEIIVIPRGIKFSVTVSEPCRSYVAEVFSGHFELPGLGPIGANGLANPRDFKFPSAAFEDVDRPFKVVCKYMNRLFSSEWDHSPFDVVAWHGNYAPFKYDLRLFNVVNTVSFDHLDPSIFTVLTVPSEEPGVAVLDFVIFPPRWIVAERTFRPPWYHRNCMSEFMGMIWGKYDAKAGGDNDESGFVAGGSSLHSCMSGHGPDAESFAKASSAPELRPVYFNEGMAFMFESKYMMKVAPGALSSPSLQKDYMDCWQPLPKLFNPKNAPIDWSKVKNDIASNKK